MQSVRAGLATLEIGEGPPVVLIHGWAGFKETWGRLPEALAAAGGRAIALDLPGVGDSPTPAGYRFGPYDAADALIRLLDELGPAPVVGHSLGAQPALIAAARRPDRVRRVALVGPQVVPPGRGRSGRWSAGGLPLTPWVGRPLTAAALAVARRRPERRRRAYLSALADPGELAGDPALVAMLEDAVRRLGRERPRSLAAALRAGLRFDLRQVAPAVAQPALVMVGERERVVHPGGAASLADALPAGRLLLVPGAGHLPHVERPDIALPALVGHLIPGAA